MPHSHGRQWLLTRLLPPMLQVINTGTAVQIEWESLEGNSATVPVAGETPGVECRLGCGLWVSSMLPAPSAPCPLPRPAQPRWLPPPPTGAD